MRQANPIGMGLVALLLGGALVVRNLPPRAVAAPQLRVDELTVLEPMQLLRPGGEERMGELDPLIEIERRDAFVAARLDLLEVVGCPLLSDWIRTRRGLALEQAAASLARGSRAEALGALALVFHVARTTSWNPGLFGGSGGAERLAGLYQRWLEEWGERAMEDSMLYEPALAATLAYGHVMQVASEGNLFRGSSASRDRARSFLRRLLGVQGERRTALGSAFGAQYPDALAGLERDGNLAGFAREALLAFPGLDGDCSE